MARFQRYRSHDRNLDLCRCSRRKVLRGRLTTEKMAIITVVFHVESSQGRVNWKTKGI